MSEADSAARLVSGHAWHDFCDVLRMAGDAVEQMGGDITDVDRAEWYRCVTRVLRVACERYLENAEPDQPRLRITPWRTSINVQSPDQDHLLCELVDRGDTEYVISGTRGTVPYFVVAAMAAPGVHHPGAASWAVEGFEGLVRFDPSKSHALASISSRELEFDDDGRFVIHVGKQHHDRNWLPLDDAAVGLIVRTVHHDRTREVAPTFAIERCDPLPRRPRTPAEVSDGLARAAQMTLGFVNRFREWKHDLSAAPNTLEFSDERYLSHGGVADRQFAFGVWRKPAGAALVVEFEPPECDYWNFQLCNIWEENLDNYEDGQGHVTKFTAATEPDGRVRVVIADADPGLGGNWIDSFRHTTGLMGLRFINTAPPGPVSIRLVEQTTTG
jgi:hypothetical protein